MTGPEHYREAERILREGTIVDRHGTTRLDQQELTAIAQVHATLALTAATLVSGEAIPPRDWREWEPAIHADSTEAAR